MHTHAVDGCWWLPEVFLKILQNSQENNCARVFFWSSCMLKACNFIKEEILAEFFCKFSEQKKACLVPFHFEKKYFISSHSSSFPDSLAWVLVSHYHRMEQTYGEKCFPISFLFRIWMIFRTAVLLMFTYVLFSTIGCVGLKFIL